MRIFEYYVRMMYFRICDVNDIRREWSGGEDQTPQTAATAEEGRDEEIPDRAEEKEEGDSQTTGGAAQEKARGEWLFLYCGAAPVVLLLCYNGCSGLSSLSD